LVASDGGIFAFGAVRYYGSTGATLLTRPIVGAAAVVAGTGYWLLAADGGIFPFGSAPSLGSDAPAPPAAYAVGVRQETFVDTSRPTGTAAPTRTLTTTIWYPTAGAVGSADLPGAPILAPGHFPLVVFAHGWDNNPAGYEVLLHAWAQAGYVVAAPALPLTALGSPFPLDESDLTNEPADLSFVLTSMIALQGVPGGWAAGLFDPTRVAAAGHSDGAEVAAAVVLSSAAHDPRFLADLVLSGALAPIPGGSYGALANPPVLVAQGDADASNRPSDALGVYDAAHDPRAYLDIVGGGHLPPYIGAGPQSDAVRASTVDFLDGELRGDPNGLDRLAFDGNEPGITALTSSL